jgi:DNA-directed RNA polymerase specialized sigma24 family protein
MEHVASEQDVVAVEPVLRRIIAARVSNPTDVDDLVHDGLERLLKSRHRLASEAVLPYAIVVAQNLVTSRTRRHARRIERPLPEAISSSGSVPEDSVVTSEAHEALLAYQERRSPDSPTTEESTPAIRVRMARSRGKLRVEYLLALRRVELPSSQCRRVLLAISAGDIRRQGALKVGDHLMSCQTCAALSEPLSQRSLGLTSVSLPFGFVAATIHKVRAHPTASAIASGAVACGVAAAIAFSAAGHTRPATDGHATPSEATGTSGHRAHPAAPVNDSTPPIPGLDVGAEPLPVHSLATLAGSSVSASSVLVQSVATHNGFWIGTDATDRIFVQLVGPLRPLRIVAGDRLNFMGSIVVQAGSYATSVGVTSAEGAGQLISEGAHIEAPTPDVSVTFTP